MFTGAVLAHVRRRLVMILGELVRFGTFAAVTVAAFLCEVTFAHLIAATALAGAAMVFVDISAQSFLPFLVRPGALFAANSRLQNSDGMSKLGSAVAGAVIDVVGPAMSVAVNAVPFLLSDLGRTRVRTIEPSLRPEHCPEPVTTRIRRGFSFVWLHEALRCLVCASALRGFGMGAVDTVLLFVYRVLGMFQYDGGPAVGGRRSWDPGRGNVGASHRLEARCAPHSAAVGLGEGVLDRRPPVPGGGARPSLHGDQGVFLGLAVGLGRA
ncbi:hypothetical protein [Nocardiopsis dassonvillei]|uniref:hypothetical protein n=1 Tax=Nocardiopsis dassonvillei TaxID=2014 RepID=UPI0033EA738F